MSAKLPRSQAGKTQPKLAASSKEAGSKKKSTMSGGSFQHQLSGKSARELAKGDHPWSGVAEALLSPLPPDWRNNIEQAFSNIGEALGKMLGGGGKEGGHRQVGRGRRGGF